MSFLHIKTNSKAFTLIEILIYTAIFGVVAAGIIGVAWNITRLHTTQIASNEIDENLRYVMNLVNSKVREATMIEQASGTTLILRMPDSTKSPTTFSLSNGTLYIQEGSADPVAITSNRVEVTSLNFEYLSVAGSKGGVRINITMAYKEQPGIASREYLTTVTKVNAITFDSDILPDVNNLRNVGAPNYRWKEGYFSGDVTVQGNVSSSGFIMGGAGLCMGSDCRTSWGQVTGVTGSGTQNYIPKWTSSGAIGNSQIFDNGTNVGIGTTSPGAKLHVSGGDILIDNGAAYRGKNSDGTSVYMMRNDSSNNLIIGSGGWNNISFDFGGVASRVYFKSDGSVGIGTASPPSLLSVGASSQFQVNSSGDIVKIKGLTYSWPSSQGLGFLKNDGSGNLTWDTSGAVGGSGSAGQIAFWNSTTTITGDSGLYWDNTNKRLGIGTTSPAQKLSVVGDIGLSGADRFIGTTDNYALSLKTNNTTRIQITADGNVGIGTTSPSRTLDVAGTAQLRGAAGGLGLYVDSGGNVGIGTTAPAATFDVLGGKLVVTSSGNVGIGTTSPSQKLHVEGNTYISGNVGIGTSSPASKLHVVGSSTGTDYLALFAENGITPESSAALGSIANRAVSVQGAGSAYFMGRDVTNDIEFIMGTSNAGAAFAGSMTAHDFQLRTGNITKMTIQNSTGNVGIGTTSPRAKLHVYGGASGATYYGTTGMVIENSGHAKLEFSTPATYQQNIVFSRPGNVEIGHVLYDHSVDTLKFRAGGTETMYIKSGNVGIGTTSPSVKLHVYESDAAKSGALINIATTSSSYYSLNVQSGGTSRLYVRADGNVGIGTTSPSERLTLSGGKLRVDSASNSWGQLQLGNPGGTETSLAFLNNNGSAIDYSTPTNNNAAFIMGINPYNVGTTNWALTSKITTATPIILATQSGNVGIGTTSPSYKLDVAGDIRSSGKTYLGTAGFYAQYEYKTSGDVPAAGWYKVAHIDGAAGRGQQQVTIYTTGGSYTPRSTTFRWYHDWYSGAGVSVVSEMGSGYWTDVRVTDDGTNSYLEVNFTQAITGLNIGLQYIGGHDLGTIYSGTLPAGGGTVRATTKANGLFALTDKFIVDASGNVGIGTTNPGKKLDVYGGEIRVTSDDTTGALVINRVSNPDQALYLRGGAGSGEGRVASQYSLELKAGLGGGGAFNLTLSTAAGEAMRILGSNNNIGIGTANPGYKLEVAGSFKSSSGGGNLIQDTSGNVIIEL